MSESKKRAWRIGGILTYVVFGIGCLLLGFLGNVTYSYLRLEEQSDPDVNWGTRALFFQAPSFGGFVETYVPEKLLTVKREETLYTFKLVSTTRFIMKPDVMVVAPGAEVQVKYRQNSTTGEKTALQVRLISRSEFK